MSFEEHRIPSQGSAERPLGDLLMTAAARADELEKQLTELQEMVGILRNDYRSLREQFQQQDRELTLAKAQREGYRSQLRGIDGAFAVITRQLGKHGDDPRARTDCLREVLEHCGANLSNPSLKRIALFELTQDGAGFTFPVRIGFGAEDPLEEMSTLNPENSFAGRALNFDSLQYLGDIRSPEASERNWLELPNFEPTHLSIACARIMIGGTKFGVLSVDSREKDDFDPNDQRTIERFARLAGLVYGVFSV